MKIVPVQFISIIKLMSVGMDSLFEEVNNVGMSGKILCVRERGWGYIFGCPQSVLRTWLPTSLYINSPDQCYSAYSSAECNFRILFLRNSLD